MGKRIDEEMLLRAEPMLSNNKIIADVKNIKIEIKLLDEDKKDLTEITFIDKIPKAEKTADVQAILDKYNSSYSGEYIIKYETTAKKIANKLGIQEIDEKYKEISYLSFRIDADCSGTFDKTDTEQWFDVAICKGIIKEMLVAMGCEKASNNKELIDALNKYCCQYDINTPLRVAHFLAQAGHESRCFTNFAEDDTYRESIALQSSCYEKYRESPEGKNIVLEPMIKNGKQVDFKCKQPEYFNCKYGGKQENTKTNLNDKTKQNYYQIDDGYKYLGRGLIQITRRSAYRNFTQRYNAKYPDDKQDFESNPQLVSNVTKYIVASACDYWLNNGIKNKNINLVADKGSDDSVVLVVSKEVNGYGQAIPNGYDDPNKPLSRLPLFKKLKIYMGL